MNLHLIFILIRGTKKEEGKMSKKLLAIFLLLGVLTYAEDNDTAVIINDNAQKATDNGEVITTEVTKKSYWRKITNN